MASSCATSGDVTFLTVRTSIPPTQPGSQGTRTPQASAWCGVLERNRERGDTAEKVTQTKKASLAGGLVSCEDPTAVRSTRWFALPTAPALTVRGSRRNCGHTDCDRTSLPA